MLSFLEGTPASFISIFAAYGIMFAFFGPAFMTAWFGYKLMFFVIWYILDISLLQKSVTPFLFPIKQSESKAPYWEPVTETWILPEAKD